MNRTRRGVAMFRTRRNRHRILWETIMRWPNMIPDSDVELPARLADWAALYGISPVCVQAALEYRQHCAPGLDFEQLKKLAMLAGQQREDGLLCRDLQEETL